LDIVGGARAALCFFFRAFSWNRKINTFKGRGPDYRYQ